MSKSLATVTIGVAAATLFATACSSDRTPIPETKTDSREVPAPTSASDSLLTSEDLDCSPNRARSSISHSGFRLIEFTEGTGMRPETAVPLSTPTAAPGRTVTTAYANVVGGDTDCFLIGSAASVFIGGTHDMEEPMLLRFTVNIPSGLELLDSDHAPPVIDGVLVQEFEITDRDGGGLRSGNHGLRFTSAVPGAYEIGISAEWFRLSSMTPHSDPLWPATRTFTLYALEE